MGDRIDKLISALKFGTFEERIESLTLMRRKVNEKFLTFAASFDKDDLEELASEIQESGPLMEEEINKLKSALLEVLNKPLSLVVMFYACVTLIELGFTDCEFLESFLDVSQKIITFLSTDPEISGSVNGAMLEFTVQEETVNCLAKFKSCPGISEIIERCFEGQILVGKQREGGMQNLKKLALYAFGEIGDDNYKPLVEYWAKHSIEDKEEKDIVNAAILALKAWGSDKSRIILEAIKDIERKQGVEGEDVVCLAEKLPDGWLCICGTKNNKNAIVCSNCRRNRDYVLSKYTIENFKL